MLFTGSVNRNVGCSGSWLAEHEYVIADVSTWWFLARSGRHAGATSLATHGDLIRCARHRSQAAYGIGDELRGSFVADGNSWGAGFLRDDDRPWFTDGDVRFLASLRRDHPRPAFRPRPPRRADTRAQSKMVQAVAARARALGSDADPLQLAARSRVHTRSGSWLLLYGTRLAGGTDGRTAVVLQPAAAGDVAPLIALAYGLSDRECQVVRLCIEGRPTKEIAKTLHLSPWASPRTVEVRGEAHHAHHERRS